jgi:hypothetical protein
VSRNFTNTLLFDSALDAIPSSQSLLWNTLNQIVHPTIEVGEDACNTLLGETIAVDYDAQGRIELSTGLPINKARIIALLGQGIYSVSVRSTATCISQGGVCRACIASSYPEAVLPAIGSYFQLKSRLEVDVFAYSLPASSVIVSLPHSTGVYDTLVVFQNGLVVPSSTYSISESTLTFGSPSASIRDLTFKFYVNSAVTFYYWLAETYAGSLLGIKPIGRGLLVIRKELLLEVIPEADIDALVDLLSKSEIVPEDSRNYLVGIMDPLEKAIFALVLSAIFLI